MKNTHQTEPPAPKGPNAPRLRQVLERESVSAVICTTPENITYATGYNNWPIYTFRKLSTVAVVTASGASAIIVPNDACEYLVETPLTNCEIYTYGAFHIAERADYRPSQLESELLRLRADTKPASEPLALLPKVVTDLNLKADDLSLDVGSLSPDQTSLVERLLGAELRKDGSRLLLQVRQCKTEDEIECLRYAAQSVEAAMFTAFDSAGVGVSERDLQRAFYAAATARGIQPGHCETNVGLRAAGCYPASDRARVSLNDAIRSDCGGRYNRYHADTGRSAVIGEPSRKIRTAYDAIRAGMDELLNTIAPGIRPSELFRVGVETVQQNGLPEFRRHHAGHGIGLEMYEAPILRPCPEGQVDEPLESGMVINIELPYYEVGVGGLQIEDTIVVGETPRRLTDRSYDLYTIA